MEEKTIIGLSFMTAASCNLNCSFCYLHKNEAFKAYDKNILTAWEDGSYIKNSLKSLKILNSDPIHISNIDIWGGETLLFIDKITPNLPLLFEFYPNIETFNISTNWMINIDNFIKFIKELDKYANKDIRLRLQLSIDGPSGNIMKTGHNGNWDTYYENIDKFTNYFNNYNLKKVNILFTINSTVNQEIYFQEFSTLDGMKNYFDHMYAFVKYIESKCISKHLECGMMAVFPGFALPYLETTEDGLELAKICRRWELLKPNYPEVSYYFSWFNGIGNLDAETWLTSENVECGEMSSSITLLPDGSLVQCSSSYMEHNKLYQNELLQKNELEELKKAKRLATHHFDLHNMTKEELEDFDWYVYDGAKNNKTTYMHMMMITADEMAQSGQIPYYFHINKEYLWKLVKGISNVNTCMRENLRDQGNIFLMDPGAYRRYLNGVMQYVYELTMTEFKEQAGLLC